MNTKSFIYASALAGLSPYLFLGVVAFGFGDLLLAQLGASVLFGLVSILFSIHAFKETRLPTRHKVLWTVGMILLPGVLNVGYWFAHIWPNFGYLRYAELDEECGV